MSRLAVALFLLISPSVGAQDYDPELVEDLQEEELPPLTRTLANLSLGDDLDDVQTIYPPSQKWYPQRMSNGVTRYKLDSSLVRKFHPEAELLFLGFKDSRLVEIQIVYHERFTRRRSAEEMAAQLALEYGPFRRNETRFWWVDDRTVLRVIHYALPILKEGVEARAFRTSLQVMERSVFQPRRRRS